nr:reverse transcriptase domain-containing protein [Tanacetum cinerariifolium]
MTTVNQGMSVEEIEQVVAQRVANAIEAIDMYEMKTNLAHKLMSQTEQQEEEVAENASNKRKWESNHDESLSQQNKGHKVPRAHTAWPINKKAYDGSLPLCNQRKSHHSGPCTVKCGNCNEDGHIIQNCRTPATGGKVTLGLSALRSKDSNYKDGDAAGSGMGRIGGDAGSGGDGICGNGSRPKLGASPKKDLSWTGLPEFADDTVTDYSRPSPTVEIDRPTKRPTTNKAENVKKPTVKYAEMYRRPSKKPIVRGNQ